MRFAGIETHQIRRLAPLVKDFCISYMTSSKKIKIVKIIKQSYEFNTESQKKREGRSRSPQFREVPALTSYKKITEVQKEVSRKNDDLFHMFPRRAKSRESKQNRLATEGGRSSTEREPKRTETEPNGISQRGAKQNRTRTQGDRSRT